MSRGVHHFGANGRRSLGQWQPLWDGKTLTGWHKIGTGTWTIEDGAIVGRKEAKDGEFGHLVAALESQRPLVYEAHSTDYQSATALRELVDGAVGW